MKAQLVNKHGQVTEHVHVGFEVTRGTLDDGKRKQLYWPLFQCMNTEEPRRYGGPLLRADYLELYEDQY